MTTDFFADLQDDIPVATKADTRKSYPCGQCAGTGSYRGARIHQEKSHCFACKGTGFFLTDPRVRQQNRTNAKKRKADQKESAIAAFVAANEGVYEFLSAATWSAFAQSMAEQIGKKGTLSEKQMSAATSMIEKSKARDAERAAKIEANAVNVDLAPITAMFTTAFENGRKRPTYRAEGLVLSRAPDNGRNAGAIYVKAVEGGEYLGKVVAGSFHPTREGVAVINSVETIAANPSEAAVRYGHKTGSCSCCGRKLTNKNSIALGIGPICAENWGL